MTDLTVRLISDPHTLGVSVGFRGTEDAVKLDVAFKARSTIHGVEGRLALDEFRNMVIVQLFDVVDWIFHGLGKVLNLEAVITCELSEPLKARVEDGHHDFLVADLGQFVGFGEN